MRYACFSAETTFSALVKCLCTRGWNNDLHKNSSAANLTVTCYQITNAASKVKADKIQLVQNIAKEIHKSTGIII